MNSFFKLVLKVIGLNLLFCVLCLAPSFFGNYSGYDGLGAFIIGLVVMGVALLIQFVVGIAFSAGEKRKELGQALLLSTGIFVLIGFSICGGLGMFG